MGSSEPEVVENKEERVYPRILGYLKELPYSQGRGLSQLLWPKASALQEEKGSTKK